MNVISPSSITSVWHFGRPGQIENPKLRPKPPKHLSKQSRYRAAKVVHPWVCWAISPPERLDQIAKKSWLAEFVCILHNQDCHHYLQYHYHHHQNFVYHHRRHLRCQYKRLPASGLTEIPSFGKIVRPPAFKRIKNNTFLFQWQWCLSLLVCVSLYWIVLLCCFKFIVSAWRGPTSTSER